MVIDVVVKIVVGVVFKKMDIVVLHESPSSDVIVRYVIISNVVVVVVVVVVDVDVIFVVNGVDVVVDLVNTVPAAELHHG
jgi:hypothetical protein